MAQVELLARVVLQIQIKDLDHHQPLAGLIPELIKGLTPDKSLLTPLVERSH